MDDFLQEIDEDVEGMQSTILFLQQELKAVRAESDRLKQTYEPEHAPMQENDNNTAPTTPLNGNTLMPQDTDNQLTKPGSEQIVTKINLSRTQNGNNSVNTNGSIENTTTASIDKNSEEKKTNGDSINEPEHATESLKRGYDNIKTSESEIVNPVKRTRRTAAIETNKKLCSIDTNSGENNKKVNGIVNVSS